MTQKKLVERYSKFAGVARAVAELSKDPSTKVGAVILDDERRIRAVGFNGFPRGVSDDVRLNDRDQKLPLMVHAEANAIANAAAVGTPLKGCSMVTTKYPCHECAKLIISAGIKLVVTPVYGGKWSDSSAIAESLFREAGITVFNYEV
jgi:dCMP deaminase